MMAGALVIGQRVPNFVADTTDGEINFFKFKEEKWCLVFSHQSGLYGRVERRDSCLELLPMACFGQVCAR